MTDEPLARLIRALPALGDATGCRIVLIGGVARGVWAAPRATMDVDVLIDAEDARVVEDAAAAGGLVAIPEEVRALASSGMTRLRLPDQPRGSVRLDVIAADHPFYRRIIGRSREIEVLGVRVWVAGPEDLILLKLLADRPQDVADVAAIAEAQAGALDVALITQEAAAIELELPPGLLDVLSGRM